MKLTYHTNLQSTPVTVAENGSLPALQEQYKQLILKTMGSIWSKYKRLQPIHENSITIQIINDNDTTVQELTLPVSQVLIACTRIHSLDVQARNNKLLQKTNVEDAVNSLMDIDLAFNLTPIAHNKTGKVKIIVDFDPHIQHDNQQNEQAHAA